MQISRRSLILGSSATLLTAGFAATQLTAQSTSGPVYVNRGVALGGTDPVAYFTDSAVVQGSGDFTHDWNGTTWQFSSAANRDAFAANPDQYAPQYGGFCAWAVSEGYTAPTDPNAWKIVDGKLYLNYNRRIQRRWEKDVPGNISRGDVNWPKIVADS